ncbi:hypothetical protein [Streptomyces sp. NPDC102487]
MKVLVAAGLKVTAAAGDGHGLTMPVAAPKLISGLVEGLLL